MGQEGACPRRAPDPRRVRHPSVDAPLDDIARRAGVGNATMYRHFPTRRELIIAVYAEEVSELCARSESLLAEDRPRRRPLRLAPGLHRPRGSQAGTGAVDHR
ncbi:TetR/AcrR family transcriptional regulator [Amycolatopsis magusensis]|uniref:TetR/AcrR family transcriptional regulator n=1 Tax=Amycolatopsis magusensis TaxID=882444 RepID=UPI0034D3FE59